ncbi:MAG: preprotein translocase subunit SecE [Candidatus Sericytochromatia bacterium]|nr:preprotein translocase subunit SecE [Candidatus Tanganyikabacteria bacterium]
MAEIKPPKPPEEEPLEAPPPAPAPELNPALTLKGAGGVPAFDRLGPWFGKTRTFFQEVAAEFKKISWPTRRQIAVETGVVILISAMLTGLVMGYDWLFALLANKVFYGH